MTPLPPRFFSQRGLSTGFWMGLFQVSGEAFSVFLCCLSVVSEFYWSLMISQISCSSVGNRFGDSMILPISTPLGSSMMMRGIFSTPKVKISGGEGGIRHFEVWLSGSFFIPPNTRTSIPVFSAIKARTGTC